MRMQFTVGMGRNERIDEIGSHAKVAEDSGFSHMTLVDQQNLSRDIYVMMGMAAINTRRIKIGQGVTQPYTYHPSVIANGTATINELSGGRAFLGIGAGGNALRSMGQDMGKMAVFRESVEFIKKYMSGKEAEYQGSTMHSEWVKTPVPIYMASAGARSLQLSGELGDGVIFFGAHPILIKWNLEQIEKGASRVGRDPSKIDTWLRTLVYVADNKEAARRECASYAGSIARHMYWYLQSNRPEVAELGERLETAEPGLIDEFKKVYEAWDEYEHEKTDAGHAGAVTQRIIDFCHLTGTPEDICERIAMVGEMGVKTISTTTFTIIDKKEMMQKIGNQIMPHFRN